MTPLSYLHTSQWVTEGSPWRPSEAITLRDEAGVPIGSTVMTTMLLTLYNVATDAIVNGLDGTVDVKNTRGCTLSTQGVFVLNLGSADTELLDPTKDYEVRRALVQLTWAAGVKSDALEITFVVRNVHRRPS